MPWRVTQLGEEMENEAGTEAGYMLVCGRRAFEQRETREGQVSQTGIWGGLFQTEGTTHAKA